jgi:arylsulfatase A-like enzyme
MPGISRRRFLQGAAGGAAALALARWLAAGQGAAPAAPGKPNIIFILFDDLGYGEPPGFRKDSPFKMPNLDRLAREGVTFSDAHSAAAVCTPTRYGVLTGRYPFRIGQFGVLSFPSKSIIEKDRMTVASMLKARGYHTACFGKWHLGMDWGDVKAEAAAKAGTPVADGPTTRGFDVFCGYTEARSIRTVIEGDRVLGTYEPVEVQPLMAKKAVEYIDARAKDGKPFFLYQPLSIPHVPHVPAKEFEGKSGQGVYGDWIFEGDWVVGRILEALQRGGLAENTLVIISSDNGAEGRQYPPLRGSKRSIYEGGHREPFLARWPVRIKAGSVCEETVCLNDLLATCAEIIGAKLPDNAGEDSVSILPHLLGTAQGPVREATVHQSSAGDLAIRQGPWKLIFFKNGKRELYNLKDDLSETQDVLAANPDLVDRLTKLMQQYIDNGRSTPGAPQKNGVSFALPKPVAAAAGGEGGGGGEGKKRLPAGRQAGKKAK